jgi:hypothetical protein
MVGFRCAKVRLDSTLSPSERRLSFEQYAKRTSIEPCFKDSKQVMQIDKPQHWCRESIEKLAPWVWIAQTLLSLWYLTEGRHSDEAEEARELMNGVWGTEWSIRHAMEIFRRASIRPKIASISHREDDLRGFVDTLGNYLYLAG